MKITKKQEKEMKKGCICNLIMQLTVYRRRWRKLKRNPTKKIIINNSIPQDTILYSKKQQQRTILYHHHVTAHLRETPAVMIGVRAVHQIPANSLVTEFPHPAEEHLQEAWQ
ncbi:hypothetical protein V8G54_007229 [Vigna mungo]|uniref:Uncharacterized protein n=1 Tax=Vigna mungo TaxID=3915 RepID=A0AAQ3S760_VIGMU